MKCVSFDGTVELPVSVL